MKFNELEFEKASNKINFLIIFSIIYIVKKKLEIIIKLSFNSNINKRIIIINRSFIL